MSTAPALSPGARAAASALVSLGVVAAAAITPGCTCGEVQPNDKLCRASTLVAELGQSYRPRMDLLLVIDNSRSMADKQEILARAVPDLIQGLANPQCLDPAGAVPPVTPASPADGCPDGMQRRFEPLADIHIGVLSSSIGGFGSDSCSAATPETRSNNDQGHLLARTSPAEVDDLGASTYGGKRFLAWDPAQQLDREPHTPGPEDGEADLHIDSDADLNSTALLPLLAQMVRGVGQAGCGYESQLESWYRFLVDPEPYQTLSVIDGQAVPEGIDEELLAQRADFLRPDSLLTILLLTDENDCSIRESGQYYYAAQQYQPDGTRYHLPRARAVCATDPDDECCRSCGQAVPDGCPVDPTCYVNGDPAQGVAMLSDLTDSPNLRCFDQKRRFGIDFLYPIDRYTQALSSPQITTRTGEIVDNPIFSDLVPTDDIAGGRDPGLVFFAGIVGVPWQDIARDPGDLTLGFKSSDELNQPVGGLESVWELILGDPEQHRRPADPFMIESHLPRAGTNPITGDAADASNSINGNDYQIPDQDDLQYACVFDLPVTSRRDCSIPGTPACDCEVGNPTNNPLCDPASPQIQIKAKAYPGIRELSLIRSMGGQGIVGSVCPAQLTDDARADYGYRPAIGALIDRLTSSVGTPCLPRAIPADDQGAVDCLIIEARRTGGACDCAGLPGRRPVGPELQAVVDEIRSQSGGATWDCMCEISQLAGDELSACQSDASEPVQTSGGDIVHGFCYVDADQGLASPEVAEEVLGACPDTERRLLRFVGGGQPVNGATTFLACGSSC